MIRPSAGYLCVWVALLVFTTAIETRATSPIPRTLEELSVEAEYVVLGRVVASEARLDDRRATILTYTTVEVDQSIAGDPPARLEIVEYGGRVGELAAYSSGQVSYAVGERVFVFACRDALDLLRTCGARQGRLRAYFAGDEMRAEGVLAGKVVRENVDQLRQRVLQYRTGAR